MTEIDFDRLGDVWRQQPEPAEMARLQRTAAAVAKRARLAQIVDIGAAIAVASVVIVLVLSNPSIKTVVMGAAAILVLLYSNVRQRKLRQVELRSLTGGTEEMLDQSIERIEATLRHNRFTLIGMWPIMLIAILFAATVERQGGSLIASLWGGAYWFRVVWLGAWGAAMVALVLFLTFAIHRGRRELGRLQSMRESYRQERESSGT
jgi:hypothetical protein